MNKEIKEILELNSKRTQGEWEWHDGGGGLMCWAEGKKSWRYVVETHIEDYDSGREETCRQPNLEDAQFIAAAPKMVEIIKKQQELLVECRGRMEDIARADPSMSECAEDMVYEFQEAAEEILEKLNAAIGEK